MTTHAYIITVDRCQTMHGAIHRARSQATVSEAFIEYAVDALDTLGYEWVGLGCVGCAGATHTEYALGGDYYKIEVTRCR